MSDVFDHLVDLLTPYSVRIVPVSDQYPDLMDRLIARADELDSDLSIVRSLGEWRVDFAMADPDFPQGPWHPTFEEAARKALALPRDATSRD